MFPVTPWKLISIMVLITLQVYRSSTDSLSQHQLCSQCNCDETDESKVLNCNQRNLTEIPSLTGKYTNFSLLFFVNNFIKVVHQFPELRNVRELDLARNNITDIDDSAFKNLAGLNVLDLSYNRLKSEKLLPRIFQVCRMFKFFVFFARE